MKSKAYQENGENISCFTMSKMIPALKEEYPWLAEVDSSALNYSLRALDAAYQNFFRRVKKGEKPGFPKFHSRYAGSQSYQTQNIRNRIRIEGDRIRLPKLGLVKIKVHRPVEGEIKSATIRRTSGGRYQVSLNVVCEIEPKENAGGEVGISLNAGGFCASDGAVVNNPQYLEKTLVRLAREQKKLSRMEIGSANRAKQVAKVAKLYERVSNQRKDFQHKQSVALVRENKTIYMEKIPVKDVIEKKTGSREMSDMAIGSFCNMVNYKAKLYGGAVVDVPTELLSAGIGGENSVSRAKGVLEKGQELNIDK